MVVATIDGKVVSWENNWFGGAAAPTDAPAPVDAAPAAAPTAESKPSKSSSDKSSKSSKDKSSKSPIANLKNKISSSGKDWDRVAYYNAKDGVADNMVFLGNYGGEGSGVFDT